MVQKVYVRLLIVFFLFISTCLFASSVQAVERYATCDECGYCPLIVHGTTASSCDINASAPPPGDWKQCVKCMYPFLYPQSSNPNPSDCLTVKIDPTTDKPVARQPGTMYTMLGCISTSGSWTNPAGGGASSLVKILFDILVFRVAGGIAFLYLLYGGFLILTSQADPEKLNHGRRVIQGAIIGLVLTLGTVFIVNIIASGILRIPGFSAAP